MRPRASQSSASAKGAGNKSRQANSRRPTLRSHSGSSSTGSLAEVQQDAGEQLAPAPHDTVSDAALVSGSGDTAVVLPRWLDVAADAHPEQLAQALGGQLEPVAGSARPVAVSGVATGGNEDVLTTWRATSRP